MTINKNRLSRSAAYVSWRAMLRRCYDPRDNRYDRYGAVGIKVCDRWRLSFANFLADMGPRPQGTTLDRIQGEKGYEPGNVRWATPAEQARNRKSTVFLAFDGQRLCLTDWAQKIGIGRNTLKARVGKNRWPLREALTTPANGRRFRKRS